MSTQNTVLRWIGKERKQWWWKTRRSLSLLRAEEEHPSLPLQPAMAQNYLETPARRIPRENHHGKDCCGVPWLKMSSPQATAGPSETIVSDSQQFRSQGLENPHGNAQRGRQASGIHIEHPWPEIAAKHTTPEPILPTGLCTLTNSSLQETKILRQNLCKSIKLERWAGRGQKGRNNQQLHAQMSDPVIPLPGICAINTLLCERKDGCSLQQCLVRMSYVQIVWTTRSQ